MAKVFEHSEQWGIWSSADPNHPLNDQHWLSFSEYLSNPNTVIRVGNFVAMVNYFKSNPEIAIQIIFSTTNCIDGRPVMLHNSSILLLRFLVQNNRQYDEMALDGFIEEYLNDPIRKDWLKIQDWKSEEKKITKKKIIDWIRDYYNWNSWYSELANQNNSFDLAGLVDLLTEWSGYPWWWLGFVINYTDMLVKNRNEVARLAGISETELMQKIEKFYNDYGHLFYFHSCSGNYGWSCKYDGCAAMKYFMGDQNIDSGIQWMVNKYILWVKWKRRSTILNGQHNEKNRITVIYRNDNAFWVWVRNDVSTERELGSEQSFVLNLQLESLMFDAITSHFFPGNDDVKHFVRAKSTESLKNHLGNINPRLWDHKIEIWTIVNGEASQDPAIDTISNLLAKI